MSITSANQYAFPRISEAPIGSVDPQHGMDLRQYFAAHAPKMPKWFLRWVMKANVTPLPPEPQEPPRLIEIKKEIASAQASDWRSAAERARSEGFAVLTQQESMVGFVLTPSVKQELEALQKAHQMAEHVWMSEAWMIATAMWPWHYADLVLAREIPQPVPPPVPPPAPSPENIHDSRD